MRDIVDDIDALVDEQLQQEPSGYDHNINQSQCCHCGRDFHGLPITERMEQMRREYHYTGNVEHLAEYRYAEDDSAILCLGSTAVGPARPKRHSRSTDDALETYMRAAYGDLARLFHVPALDWWPNPYLPRPRWWRLDNPDLEFDYELRTDHGEPRGLGPLGYREAFAPRRYRLAISDLAATESDVVSLTESASGDVYRVTVDDRQRPTRIEIYAARAPRLGGTWVELDEQGEPIPEHEYHPGGVVPRGPSRFARERDLVITRFEPGMAISAHTWMDIGYIDPEHAPCFERDAPYLHAPDIQDGDLVGYEDVSTGETVTGRAAVQQDGDEWSITIGDPE